MIAPQSDQDTPKCDITVDFRTAFWRGSCSGGLKPGSTTSISVTVAVIVLLLCGVFCLTRWCYKRRDQAPALLNADAAASRYAPPLSDATVYSTTANGGS